MPSVQATCRLFPLSSTLPRSSPYPGMLRQALTTTEGTITYTYDPHNRLTVAQYSDGDSYEYAYDEVGNRQALTTTEGTITYTYDAANPV